MATFVFYQEYAPNLGLSFLQSVEEAFERIQTNPAHYQEIHGSTRMVLISRLPYSIFYLIAGDAIVVLAVLHSARHPRAWQDGC